MWPNLGNNFLGESQEQLKKCCFAYMNISIANLGINVDAVSPNPSPSQTTAIRQELDRRFPLLEYAVRNVLYHADAAEGEGVSQMSFLSDFHLHTTNWVKYHNFFERHKVRRHTLNVSLYYLLAAHNMANLIKSLSSNVSCFQVEDGRYGTPILAALATGSQEAVCAILRVEAKKEPGISLLEDLCTEYEQDRNNPTSFKRDFKFSRRRSFLSYIAERGDEVVLAFYLASGNHSANH